MSLFAKGDDLPGLQAVVRDCTARGKGWKKLGAGEIAVIDSANITREEAQRLIGRGPSAVINAREFTTGAIPNYGPQLLLDAGIRLVEGVGAEAWRGLKNGKKMRLTDEGEVFQGEKLVARGSVVTRQDADAAFREAQRHLVDHMEAYFGNATEFIHSESMLLIDDLGVPDIDVDIRDRTVLVLSPGRGHREELANLKNFINEFHPVLIGVDTGADALVDAGYHPNLIVGNPTNIGADALRCGARVVLPADPDGFAAGLERIQDLGIGAMTFPAATDSATDLALLLADYHGASLVVNAGAPLDLKELFTPTETANPSSLLTRTKLGHKLVDAQAILRLYTTTGGVSLGWLWAVLGILVLVATVLAIAGLSGDGSFTNNLIDTWNSFALMVQGWWR